MSVTISSRSNRRTDRIVVTLTDDEYAAELARAGTADAARQSILNTAGRVLSHRGTLSRYAAQHLTAEQQAEIESRAAAYAYQYRIYAYLAEHGYAQYVNRALSGGMLPPSWDRIVSRATEATRDNQLTVTARDREQAMNDLGLISQRDADWSARITGPCSRWQIERIST
jgi:hypothetical protein